MEKQEQMEMLLDDVLTELHGDESDRPIGEGITPDDYVLSQLERLWYLLRDNYIDDMTIDELNIKRNKLNRKISTLKKANLN